MSRRRFDWRRMPGMRLAGLAALVFLYVPLLVLVVLSFNANRVAMVWGGFSPRWFTVALDNEDLRRTAVNSLVVAAVATLASTLIALPAALALERGGGWRGRAAGEALIALPLVAPEIVTAVATLVLFEVVGLHAGLGNVMLAHIVFCIRSRFSRCAPGCAVSVQSWRMPPVTSMLGPGARSTWSRCRCWRRP